MHYEINAIQQDCPIIIDYCINHSFIFVMKPFAELPDFY